MEHAAYPATDGRGKWHLRSTRSTADSTPKCGAVVELDVTAAPIIVAPGVRPHPFVCKNCLRAATK